MSCPACYDNVQWLQSFICHLPPSWSADHVRAWLSNHLLTWFGSLDLHYVAHVEVAPSQAYGGELPFGFVTFSTHYAACTAVSRLCGQVLHNTAVYMTPHIPDNFAFYELVLKERVDVVAHLCSAQQIETLTQVVAKQSAIIATLHQKVATLQNELLHLQAGQCTSSNIRGLLPRV